MPPRSSCGRSAAFRSEADCEPTFQIDNIICNKIESHIRQKGERGREVDVCLNVRIGRVVGDERY